MADDLVIVETYRTLPEAEAARIFLEAEGIPVFLADKEAVSVDSILGPVFGLIKLRGPASAAERAAHLLSEMRARQAERVAELENSEETVCLTCGATMSAGEATCRSCGWSYASGEPA
jgi:ribosomal protein L40E